METKKRTMPPLPLMNKVKVESVQADGRVHVIDCLCKTCRFFDYDVSIFGFDDNGFRYGNGNDGKCYANPEIVKRNSNKFCRLWEAGNHYEFKRSG